MTHLRHASRAAVLLPIALIFAACGGATTPSVGAAASGAAASANAAPSSAPSQPPAPSQEPAASAAVPSIGAIPSFDLGELAASLEGVDSYRVIIAIGGGQTYAGVVVTKPVLSRDLLIGTGADATHIVAIGDKAWIGQGSGPLTPAPAEMIGPMLGLFDPAILLGAFANAGLASASQGLGTETKNGVNSHHYKADASLLGGGTLGLPAGSTIEFWTAVDGGYLVSYVATGFSGVAGGDMTINVTNVNDPANKVKAPG